MKLFYSMLTYTFVIPSSKQKHTTGSLTHTHTQTHMNSNNYKQKATGHVTFGHFTGTEAPFECEIPTASSNKKRYNFADIGLAVGTPAGVAPTKECFKRLCWFGKRHKRTSSQNWGNLLSELNAPHRQCLAGISNAFLCIFYQYLAIFPAVLL